MRKITFITDFPTQYFCKALDSLEYNINIYTLFEKSSIRATDYYSKNENIYSISKGDNEYNRTRILTRVFNLLRNKGAFSNIVCICGWDYLEYWFLLFFIKPKYVILNLESTIVESKYTGISGFLKRKFLKKIDFIIVPGQRQKDLALKLGFDNEIYFLQGVGFHHWYGQTFNNQLKFKESYKNILYVGRLSKEKGIDLILAVAELLPDFNFTIIGSGPKEDEIIKSIENKSLFNINLIGYVNNIDLEKFYLNNDILILPSFSEVWGLVIEEAAHFQIPIISSDIVGCVDDYILKYNIGLVFRNKDILDFKEKLEMLSHRSEYSNIKSNFQKMNLYKENPFVNAFEKIISKCL
jgi:glycosyltransferase involved in cell wall biosynthesis